MKLSALDLLPYPRKIVEETGSFKLSANQCLNIPVGNKDVLFPIAVRLKGIIETELSLTLEITVGEQKCSGKGIVFIEDNNLSNQGYQLKINPDQIKILYKSPVGAFYAVSTLKQLLLQQGRILTALKIEDYPDFKVRGLMLDISRDKIPQLKTLYQLVDLMADLKLNHLQLYIEGLSFAYSSYRKFLKGKTPITGEEIINLDQYCQQNFIELVANQNSFGHMEGWLKYPEFNNIAECPDGFKLKDREMEPTTLNPLDSRSLEFVEYLYDDLLPYFSSPLLNVGCDETWELGEGRSKQVCQEEGIGKVYFDFLMEIYNLTRKKNKKMMFWGDIIIKYPEYVDELPEDIIALEWGYEGDHPFAEHGRLFQEAGNPFYVCPGTSSWNTISGRTENMRQNLLNAAINGKKYGAEGYLNTDWGDNGHWQYLPVSYAGYAYGAALSWGVETNQDIDLAASLDKFIFRDQAGKMGRFVLDLGNYYLTEGKFIHNNTNIHLILRDDLEDMKNMDGLSNDNLERVLELLAQLKNELNQNKMTCKNATLIEAEFQNAIRFIMLGAKLIILKNKMMSADTDVNEKEYDQLFHLLNELITEHQQLWLARNKLGGLRDSLKALAELSSQLFARIDNS